MNDQLIEAVTDELLAHGEFSSTGNNRPNARAAAQAVIDIILRSSADSAQSVAQYIGTLKDALRAARDELIKHDSEYHHFTDPFVKRLVFDAILSEPAHAQPQASADRDGFDKEDFADDGAYLARFSTAPTVPQTAPAAPPAMSEGLYWTNQLNACWDRSMSDALKTAAQKALNYIENTEGELGMTLSCGDALRAALADTENQRSQSDSSSQTARPIAITDAMISAGLDGWFSVKPSSAESDAILIRSMRAALSAAFAQCQAEIAK